MKRLDFGKEKLHLMTGVNENRCHFLNNIFGGTDKTYKTTYNINGSNINSPGATGAAPNSIGLGGTTAIAPGGIVATTGGTVGGTSLNLTPQTAYNILPVQQQTVFASPLATTTPAVLSSPQLVSPVTTGVSPYTGMMPTQSMMGMPNPYDLSKMAAFNVQDMYQKAQQCFSMAMSYMNAAQQMMASMGMGGMNGMNGMGMTGMGMYPQYAGMNGMGMNGMYPQYGMNNGMNGMYPQQQQQQYPQYAGNYGGYPQQGYNNGNNSGSGNYSDPYASYGNNANNGNYDDGSYDSGSSDSGDDSYSA